SPWVVSLASTTITGTVTTQGNLTNNNAVPNTFNVGVLPAIAESAYTNLAYTTGDQVLPATDLHGALFSDLAAVQGVALGATAVVAYGSTPAAVNVPAVNAFITNTVPVTLASTTITGTVAVTQSTSPWVVSLASTTITGTVAVTQSTSPWVVAGALTNNNAAPTATLIGVLPAIAETAYTTVTYTTGDLVLPVTDLHGALNQDLQAVAGVQLGSTAVTNFGTAPAAAAVPGVNASLFVGTTGLTVTGTSLNANVTNFPAVQVVTLSPPTLGVTQSTSPWVSNITQWATVTLSPPTAWGAAPSGTVIGVNAELFVGNNAVSATTPVPVSATAAANAKTNPIYEAIADGTNTSVLGAMGTAPATSIFALPVIAGLIANVSG